jgi:hypothetical protein
MSSIAKIIQVLVVAAGTPSAKAIFEIQTNDPTPKRLLVSRNSPQDPLVYHLDHADIASAIPVMPTEVINMYENTWPSNLLPSLGVDGQLPDALNAQFTQADFATSKTGVIGFNGYNYLLGSFISTTPAATAANGTSTDTAKVAWYNRPAIKSGGYLALAAGLIVLAFVGLKTIFSKK